MVIVNPFQDAPNLDSFPQRLAFPYVRNETRWIFDRQVQRFAGHCYCKVIRSFRDCSRSSCRLVLLQHRTNTAFLLASDVDVASEKGSGTELNHLVGQGVGRDEMSETRELQEPEQLSEQLSMLVVAHMAETRHVCGGPEKLSMLVNHAAHSVGEGKVVVAVVVVV